jgi:hypothetical protein
MEPESGDWYLGPSMFDGYLRRLFYDSFGGDPTLESLDRTFNQIFSTVNTPVPLIWIVLVDNCDNDATESQRLKQACYAWNCFTPSNKMVYILPMFIGVDTNVYFKSHVTDWKPHRFTLVQLETKTEPMSELSMDEMNEVLEEFIGEEGNGIPIAEVRSIIASYLVVDSSDQPSRKKHKL